MQRYWSRHWPVLAAIVVAVLVSLLGTHPAFALGGAVMGATTATADIDALTKIIYSDPLITDIVAESEFMSIFQTDMNIQTEQTTGGKYIETAHYLRLAGAAGARAENDYIPVSQSAKAVNGRIFLKKIMGVIEMTGDVMDRVVGDEGAFINYMERALPDTKERVLNEVDRMYIGFGAGIKARVAATWAGASPLPVDRALGVTGYEDAWLEFLEGETIVFSATAAGTALRNAGANQAALVENIDETTNELTITGDAALLAAIQVDDYIFGGDAAGTSSQLAGVDREIQGVLAGVDDGSILPTYLNIVRATQRQFNARVVDASVAPYNGILTEELLIASDAAVRVSANAKIDTLITSPHAPIGYWKDMKQDRTLNDLRNPQGGLTSQVGVLLGDRVIPLKTARKLPPQIAFGLNRASWRRLTLNTWTWVQRTGALWHQVTDATGRKDAYFAFGKMYEQLACLVPRRNIRFEGLARQFNF